MLLEKPGLMLKLMMMRKLMLFNKWVFYGLMCICAIALSYLSKEMFITDELYFNLYDDQLSFIEINRFIKYQDKWGWLSYGLLPVYYALKFGITASAIYTGVFFLDLKCSFKKLFQISMIAEVVFFIPAIVKIIWFTLLQPDFTLEDFASFYPLSLQNIFIGDSIEPWFLYPLQVVNVFELGYWFVLAFGISLAFKEDFNKSLSLVVKSYGLGLLLWVTLIVFLTLNFS